MKQIIMQTFASILLFCTHFASVIAQSPAPAAAPPGPTTTSVPAQPPAVVAAPPAPTTLVPLRPSAPGSRLSGPTNVTAILEKAGKYAAFIRLLKTTQAANRLNAQLNNSDQGLTILAPTDAAFAKLKSGTLNTYTSEQQTQLVQAHVLPAYFADAQFQTASNPISTQAGGTTYGQFPLNVTTSGNSVDLSTGFAKASIVATVYTDNQLAVYEVDHVLLPQKFFVAAPPSPPPAPAPAPTKHKKKAEEESSPVVAAASESDSDSNSDSDSDSSDGVSLIIHGISFQASYAFAVLAAAWLF